jgi:hypothetical protein
VTPGTQFKQFGLALIVVGAAMMGVSALVTVAIAGPAALSSTGTPISPVPGAVSVHLDAGSYVIFEQPTTDPTFPPPASAASVDVTFAPDDVTITASNGRQIQPYLPSADDGVLKRNGTMFIPAVGFQVPAAGQYRIEIESLVNSHAIVASDFNYALASAGDWIGLGFLGFLTLVSGLCLILIYARRQRRIAGRRGPPPGWYPHPLYPGQSLWWNGYAWDHPMLYR